MNKVDGSFDESLHMLIHRIMYVEKHYLRFLDSELMNEVEEDPPVISIFFARYEPYCLLTNLLINLYIKYLYPHRFLFSN
jgi:hypothetical protein